MTLKQSGSVIVRTVKPCQVRLFASMRPPARAPSSFFRGNRKSMSKLRRAERNGSNRSAPNAVRQYMPHLWMQGRKPMVFVSAPSVSGICSFRNCKSGRAPNSNGSPTSIPFKRSKSNRFRPWPHLISFLSALWAGGTFSVLARANLLCPPHRLFPVIARHALRPFRPAMLFRTADRFPEF